MKKFLSKIYLIQFSNQAKKFIRNLDSRSKQNIKEIIDKLKEDPFSLSYKKLQNLEADYRIRKGNFRIFYSVYKEKLLIRIIKVGTRENFYN